MNVLPKEAEMRLMSDYRARLITAGSLITISVAVIAALALVPSVIALRVASGALAMREEVPEENAADRMALVETKALASALSPIFAATNTPSSDIEAALSLRTGGVVIDHISFVGGSPAKLVLGGSSPRESLSRYRDALVESGSYASVSVPLGDLAGTAGGRFSMTLTMKH